MALSILFLGTQMAVGGAQRVLLTQALWFHERGYLVTVAFLYDKERLQDQWQSEYPFPVIDLGMRRIGGAPGKNIGLLLKGLLRLWGLLHHERFDIIETFTPHSNLLGLPLAFLSGVPARIGSHHGKIENIPHFWERLHGAMVNSRIASSLVTVSKRVSWLATQIEGVQPERITLIPNGVGIPPEGTFDRQDMQLVRREIAVEEGAHLVISVGRLTSQKGHIILLDAIPRVLQHFPKTVFALVGDGPLRDDLEQQGIRLGIENVIRLVGVRGDIFRLLSAADVFVLPSLSEGMPLALLEAMGMGVPILASNLEGIASVVEHGRHGLLIPAGEVESLSLALVRVLGDASLREQLAANGKQLVLANYTLDRMCEEYENLFLRNC